ncbi:905_t:CDS:1 [Ambispora gerdemannii]|uniref:905_t:CDS:1 n=1 Tax=Ambispora gerdemannii TaxID=144530 RepID=A0A9N9FT51_9GLOM|nr:905_t:CDS:1 [Ambispora gerdemannii]
MALTKSSNSKNPQKRNHSEIDELIGRRSIFQIRNSLYPPKKRAKKPVLGAKSSLLQQSNNCNSTFDGEETIKLLESQVTKIEETVNNLITANNKETKTVSPISEFGSKFTFLNTNELLNLTANLGDNISSIGSVNEQDWPTLTTTKSKSRRTYLNGAPINEFGLFLANNYFYFNFDQSLQ